MGVVVDLFARGGGRGFLDPMGAMVIVDGI
jgi:hypothetical protein